MCEVVQAVPPGPQVIAPTLDFSRRVDARPVALCVRLVASGASDEVSRKGPPGIGQLSGCALPILLGHLLL